MVLKPLAKVRPHDSDHSLFSFYVIDDLVQRILGIFTRQKDCCFHNRIVNTSSKIVGKRQIGLNELYERRVKVKGALIAADDTPCPVLLVWTVAVWSPISGPNVQNPSNPAILCTKVYYPLEL